MRGGCSRQARDGANRRSGAVRPPWPAQGHNVSDVLLCPTTARQSRIEQDHERALILSLGRVVHSDVETAPECHHAPHPPCFAKNAPPMIHTPLRSLRSRRSREESPRFSRRTPWISRFRLRKRANCGWSTADGTTRTLGQTASRRGSSPAARAKGDPPVTGNAPPWDPLRPPGKPPSMVQIFHHEIRPGDPF
jgi:hypothetical protein